MPKTSRNKEVWKSKRIPDYFKVSRSGRYKIWCATCKRIFISKYHLTNHGLKKCHPDNRIPFLALEHINDEDLIKIASYLDLQNLINLIIALPRLLICHGMLALWMRTFERCPFTPWKWICRNVEEIRDIDFFFVALKQGQINCNESINSNFSSYINGEKNCKTRRACIWWISTSTVWTRRNNVKDAKIFETISSQ